MRKSNIERVEQTALLFVRIGYQQVTGQMPSSIRPHYYTCIWISHLGYISPRARDSTQVLHGVPIGLNCCAHDHTVPKCQGMGELVCDRQFIERVEQIQGPKISVWLVII